jgi:hypothetical protein
MAIGVIASIFIIDIWYMEWIDILWSRSLMFIIKAVILGAWYENTRERLIDSWIGDPPQRTNKNYFAKVVGLDSLFSSAFNGGIYSALVLLRHSIYRVEDPLPSLIACSAVFFSSLFTGPLLGILIDFFRRLWEDVAEQGVKKAFRHWCKIFSSFTKKS